MNNSDLDNLLKKVKVPELPQQYWENFPPRITARLHWSQRGAQSAPRQLDSGRRWFIARVALAMATVCLLFALGFRMWTIREDQSMESLGKIRKYYSEIESLFPNQVNGIVFDSQGPHLLLADKSNLPNSTALYVRICSKKGCRSFVTFSGQRIRFGSDTFDVLVDRQGEVLLAGEKMVWCAAS
jgi:hypothetical protein